MARSRWYDDTILEWPWLGYLWLILIGALVAGYLFHWPWKETLAVVIAFGFYVEFDVCTTQVERLMDRVKELEDRLHGMEVRAKDAAGSRV